MKNILENKYEYSLFRRFLSILYLIFISVFLCIGWKVIQINNDINYRNLENLSQNIVQRIENEIYDFESKIHLMGNLIAEQKLYRDDSSIMNLINVFSKSNKNPIIMLGEVGWAGDDYILRFLRFNPLEEKINLFWRSYMKDMSDKPFTLLFDTIVNSRLSGRDIIPIAMGLKDEDSKYLGCITSGIGVMRLKSFIDGMLSNRKDYYAVFNTVDNKIIIHSNDFQYKYIKKELSLFIDSDLKANLYRNEKRLSAISKLNKSPLILIIGSHQAKMSYEEVFQVLIPYKSEIFFALIILSCLIYLIYISILFPFLKLSEVSFSISNGDLNTVVPQFNSKEGSLLASSLEKIKYYINRENDLVSEVLEARSNLAITDVRLENKVKERTEELEKSLQSKDSLFDYLNNAVIFPIQNISNIVNNMVKFSEDMSEVEKTDYINQISYTLKRLSVRTINLLNLSRFTTHMSKLDLIKIDISMLVTEVIADYKAMYANKKSIKFNFNSEKQFYITADRGHITQLLCNLFRNAIKFSPNNGDITINVFPTKISIGSSYAEALHFMIIDRGVELDEIEINSILSSYAQEKGFISKSGSLCLGLSICKKIVLAHNGNIWATNNKDGGATINFIIPIIQPKEIDKKYNFPVAIDLHPVIPNILMIDDEGICLNTMELMLNNTKYNLIKENSAHSGLKYLRKHHTSISLIMLDLMMPDMYGLNFLTKIKNIPELKSIPVILQTSISDEEEIIKAFEMGVTSFIRKPYTKDKVLEEIKKALITTDSSSKTRG